MSRISAKYAASIRKRAGEALRQLDCRYFGARQLRDIAAFALQADACGGPPLLLLIDHQLGGGANLYRMNRICQAQQDGKSVLLLTYDYPARRYVFEFLSGQSRASLALHSLDCVRRLLAAVSSIGEVVVNELVSFPDPLLFMDFLVELKSASRVRMSVLVHDYYCVCPGAHLLDLSGTYCRPSIHTDCCTVCLPHLDLHIKKSMGAIYDIARWRSSWEHLLMKSDRIVCFSDSSMQILCAVYPDLGTQRFVVQPHSRAHIETALAAQNEPPLRIGILGKIDTGKGSGILARMAAFADEQGLPVYFIVIGSLTPPIESGRVIVTGPYRLEELASLLDLFNIDVFLVPSILPETFSYTAEEIMCAGKPLAVFNIGAPAERVRLYNRGVVLSAVDPAVALSELTEFVRSNRSNL